METNRGLTIKDILIRLILIIIFIFLLIWLFPMPDLKPLNNQIFADNIDRMKDVAKSYYTVERLPKNINDSKRMTLKEMVDQHLILDLIDSNGKTCSRDDSYVEITKLENEYVIKVNLSCSDKQDYVIEHFGCYDICSDTCKALESTTKTSTSATYSPKVTSRKNTVRKTTTNPRVTTSQNNGKLYEYLFTKNECTEQFEKYICPSGYNLVGDICIKNGSEVVSKPADEKITNVTSTDTKPADVKIDSSTELKPADCKEQKITKTSTINAGYKKTTYSATLTTVTQKVTANQTTSYEVKGAVETKKTTDVNYITIQNYDIKTADKVISSYKWVYDYTLVDTNGSLAYENDNERLDYVTVWDELECSTCFTTVTKYKYYHYTKKAADYTYSCDAYPGYSLYDGNKCRKATKVTKKCPSGYSANGSVCSKTKTTLDCSKYGSDYKLNRSNKTCTKTNVSYTCPSGTTKTSDPKYCTKTSKEYTCPSYMEKQGTGSSMVCIDKHDYYCPANTNTKKYTLNGTKCTVKTITKSKVCSCDKYPGSVQTDDKQSCAIKNSSTTYTCDSYPGYDLKGDKCVKTTTVPKKTYTCDSYPGSTLDGTNCVKTVNTTDTKKAEKAYRTVCEQKYKWSTSTSIDGWQYTGTKREIN